MSKDTGKGTTANATRNLANLTNQKQWMGLCELASNEHDQEKLGALFEEILRLLEDQQVRLKAAADGMLHDTPASI
ncbi:MAG: hypothetical protein WCC99_15280 [Candidatus Sulfotelmatobacter sp.]